MDFGEALREMKLGKKARRKIWTIYGKVPCWTEDYIIIDDGDIDIYYGDGNGPEVWHIKDTDILAEDWEVVE